MRIICVCVNNKFGLWVEDGVNIKNLGYFYMLADREVSKI